MEKTHNSSYDHKEYMRMAMLNHEETFRQQVYELHRLYRIQKILMDTTGLSKQQQKQQQERYLVESKKAFTIDYNQLHEPQRNDLSNGKCKSNIMGLEQPDDQVLVGPITRAHTQEHIAESNSNNIKLDEGEIELTLSLGPATHNPRRRKAESGHESLSSSSTGSSQTRKTSPKDRSSTRSDLFTWGSTTFPQGSEVQPVFSNGQQNNPPWLFQALSLKLT